MIQINLSDDQAKEMLSAFGWRETWTAGDDIVHIDPGVASELFKQLEKWSEENRDLLHPQV